MGTMQTITEKEIRHLLENRKSGEHISLRERLFEPMNLTGCDLSNIDFSLSSMQDVILNHVNLENSSLENALFDGTSLHGSNLKNANLKKTAFRSCDLGECNICGADLFAAVLEDANL